MHSFILSNYFCVITQDSLSALAVAKENPTLTAAQTAKKITEFWKELSSEERGYYRDVANEEEKEQQSQKQTEESAEASETDTGKKTSRLLKLFEKMKNTKNEKKEKLNMRTIVPWNIDRAKIIERYSLNADTQNRERAARDYLYVYFLYLII